MHSVRFAAKGSLYGVIVLLLGIGLISSRPAAAQLDFSQNLVEVTPLNATDFSFSQDGFTDAALVTGTFNGTDLDLDSQLSFFDGEISAFAMMFAGNSIVPAFSLGLGDLFGLVYDLDGGPLGDGLVGDVEGIGAIGITAFYLAGPGPADVCGIGVDCAVVGLASVPEPGTWLLCATGLVGLIGYRLRRPRTA